MIISFYVDIVMPIRLLHNSSFHFPILKLFPRFIDANFGLISFAANSELSITMLIWKPNPPLLLVRLESVRASRDNADILTRQYYDSLRSTASGSVKAPV
jgi:hypothetical protein